MRFDSRSLRSCGGALAIAILQVGTATVLTAQRDNKIPAATQAFDPAECRADCSIDSLVIDVDRGRRAQSGVMSATFIFIDTLAIAKRGAPPTPRDRQVAIWFACDSSPCGAALVAGRITDKRIDDARVVRRTAALWPLPAPLMLKLNKSVAVSVVADGKVHPLSVATVAATRALVESVRSSTPVTPYSVRAQLYIATFATFGVPGDSTMAEDVGTATEPLMIPDATSTPPTRVATLTFAGRGVDAIPLLVQDDATGAAPIFGVGEFVTIALPGKVGRRGVTVGKITARQRVEVMRDACQGMKLWTYLIALPAADVAAATRANLPSPRPGEAIDRWNGTAVRETYPARMPAAEQRLITASRPTVAQFARERASTGIRDRDVQVLAALPRGAGFVTNFGVLAKDGGGNWRFPAFSLRPATCPQ